MKNEEMCNKSNKARLREIIFSPNNLQENAVFFPFVYCFAKKIDYITYFLLIFFSINWLIIHPLKSETWH